MSGTFSWGWEKKIEKLFGRPLRIWLDRDLAIASELKHGGEIDKCWSKEIDEQTQI